MRGGAAPNETRTRSAMQVAAPWGQAAARAHAAFLELNFGAFFSGALLR